MAKRRKLEAPSAADLSHIEAEFRNENRVRPNPATAPIAQVAADAAAAGTGANAQVMLDRVDAEALRKAEQDGLLIRQIALAEIDAQAMIRDRTKIDEGELAELKASIIQSGLRLPIEVYAGDDGGFSLISGFRRLRAFVDLQAEGREGFDRIKAIVRPRTDMAGAFAAMVEENEIRSALSPFERGRIAVIAAQQDAFATVDAAVAGLFASASAAKKSKIKSFAEVFEALGDLLRFPEALTERRGLRISNALRQGEVSTIRDVLGAGSSASAAVEWDALARTLDAIEEQPAKIAKRGRPKTKPADEWPGGAAVTLANGVTLTKVRQGAGYAIRMSGGGLTPSDIDEAADALGVLLAKR